MVLRPLSTRARVAARAPSVAHRYEPQSRRRQERTRIFVRHLSDWEAVARVYGERFAVIVPANTLAQGGLIGNEYLVDMEAEALAQR